MSRQLLPVVAAVLLPFVGAALVVVVRARSARLPGIIACTTTLVTTALIAFTYVFHPGDLSWRVDWLRGSGIGAGLHVDRLAAVLALVISALAMLSCVYSLPYLRRTREGRGASGAGAYFGWLLLFTGAMLGLVLAVDLVQIFVFWELAEIASFMLIGLDWRSAAVRTRALRVLVVTTSAGLLLLIGILGIGASAGTFTLSELADPATALPAGTHATAALVLLLVGAAAKAAMFPAHIWLRDAMSAPVPVNALVDSAALLAASVYLLVRLHPLLSAEPLWTPMLIGFGAASIITGGALALRARELKLILAWSTVSQYGFMFVLLGYGTATAVAATFFMLIQHAVVKAGLFFVVGIVGWRTTTWIAPATGASGTRGAWRHMPLTFATAAVLAASLAGVPPLGGFWSKELLLEATANTPSLVVLATLGAALTLAYMLHFVAVTFFGSAVAGTGAHTVPAPAITTAAVDVLAPDPDTAAAAVPSGHASLYASGNQTGDAPLLRVSSAPADGARPSASTWPLLGGPALLACVTVTFGLAPGFIGAAATGVGRSITGSTPDLKLHYEPGLPLLLSFVALAAGAVLYLLHRVRPHALARLLERGGSPSRTADGIGRLALAAGRVALRLQSGALDRYVGFTLAGLILLLAVAAPSHIALTRGWPGTGDVTARGPGILDWRNGLLLALIAVGTVATLFLRRHIHYVLALGAVGFLLAGLFGMSNAPSLGILQVHVETLVAVLLLLLLTQVPEDVRDRFADAARGRIRRVHVALAATLGLAAAWLSWVAIEHRPEAPVAPWFNEHAYELTGARDVVTAVLIHFRALDTLGEILVFATATAGAFALTRLIRERPE